VQALRHGRSPVVEQAGRCDVNARLREIERAVKDAGLRLVEGECERTGKGHYKLMIERPDGQRMLYVAGSTPSDFRAMRNMNSALRRFARTGALK
jgi:hypothetical protein